MNFRLFHANKCSNNLSPGHLHDKLSVTMELVNINEAPPLDDVCFYHDL